MPHTFVLRDSGGRDNPIGAATTIGRDAACQIVLTGDPLVSRRHALLWAQDDAVYVRDENSSNGTFVNGQRLAPNQALPLQVGDKLGVGGTLFLLAAAETPPATVIPGAPASAAAPAPTRTAARAGVLAPAAATVATPAAAAASRRRPAFLMACAVVGVLAALVVCGAGAVILSRRGPALLAGLTGAATPSAATVGTATPSAGTSGPATIGAVTPGASTPTPALAGTPAQVLSSAAAPSLLTASEYAAANEGLASAVVQLNLAELDFVRAANSAGRGASGFLARIFLRPLAGSDLDGKLLNVAANAFKTATLADRLSQTAASQAGGSSAALQTASQYAGIARVSAALVIEAQNARPGLADGSLPAKTVAGTVAEYGARLWNPAANNPPAGNPFTPLLSSAAQIPPPQDLSAAAVTQLTTQLGANLSAWVAASGETVTKTLTLPPLKSQAPVQNDAATQAKLTTAAGQADAAAAYALAGSLLQTGSANVPSQPSAGGQVQATFASSAAVTSPANQKSSPLILPAYPQGSASAVTTGAQPADTLSTQVDISTAGDVKLGAQTPIRDTESVVNLTLSNFSITAVNKLDRAANRFIEAEVLYEFDVQWTSSLVSPRFTLDCARGNLAEVTTASGTLHVSTKGLLILYPGSEHVACYASRNYNSLGSASVRFLVGDAAGATQRAQQVETEYNAIELTQTANDVSTQQAATSNAAASQAVLGTQNALETEVAAQNTHEFAATITAIARLTQLAVPVVTETPSPTATFAPVFLEELFHAGNVFAVSTKHALQPGHLYRFCFSGQVNLINPTRSVLANELDHVNGIGVPLSGCLVLEGDGKAAVISCGQGEAADDPGGFSIQVFDLGPS